jgi:hypothetical protein
VWRHLKHTSVTSLDVDLWKWKTAIYLRIVRRFENWTSIRDWTSIWVLHIYQILWKCGEVNPCCSRSRQFKGPRWLNELYVVGLHNNSYKPITNTAWVRARLCKLQKRIACTRLAAASDKVYQLLAHGRWFSPPLLLASSTTKTGRHDSWNIAERGVKHQKSNQSDSSMPFKEIVYYNLLFCH